MIVVNYVNPSTTIIEDFCWNYKKINQKYREQIGFKNYLGAGLIDDRENKGINSAIYLILLWTINGENLLFIELFNPHTDKKRNIDRFKQRVDLMLHISIFFHVRYFFVSYIVLTRHCD